MHGAQPAQRRRMAVQHRDQAAMLRNRCQQLLDMAARGAAILVISEELDELFEISDRIGVIARGKLSPIRDTHDTNAEQIGLWMAGLFDAPSGSLEDAQPVAANA